MDDRDSTAALVLCALAYYNFVNSKIENKIKKRKRPRRWWMTQIHRNRTRYVNLSFFYFLTLNNNQSDIFLLDDSIYEYKSLVTYIFCFSLSMQKQLGELVAEPSGEFKRFTRMSTVDFEFLLNKISPLIRKQDTQLRSAVPDRMRLAISLRYLATGDSFQSLHFLFKVSPQLISKTIPEVCQALNKVLQTEIQVSITMKLNIY